MTSPREPPRPAPSAPPPSSASEEGAPEEDVVAASMASPGAPPPPSPPPPPPPDVVVDDRHDDDDDDDVPGRGDLFVPFGARPRRFDADSNANSNHHAVIAARAQIAAAAALSRADAPADRARRLRRRVRRRMVRMRGHLDGLFGDYSRAQPPPSRTSIERVVEGNDVVSGGGKLSSWTARAVTWSRSGSRREGGTPTAAGSSCAASIIASLASRSLLPSRRALSLHIKKAVRPVAAALIMHLPGLAAKWPYEGHGDYLCSLAGAAVEGALLLSLAERGWRASRAMHRRLSERSHGASGSARALAARTWIAISLAASAWSFAFALSSISGDAAFRDMSGNDSPSADVVRAGFEDAKEEIEAQFAHDPTATLRRFAFGLLCVAGSVGIYFHPSWRRWKDGKEGRGVVCGGDGADDGNDRFDNDCEGGRTATRVPEDFGANSRKDVEQQRFPFEADATSARRCSSAPPSWRKQGGMIVLAVVACVMCARHWYTPVLFAYYALLTDVYVPLGAPGTTFAKAGSKGDAATGTPNVIYLQHESLSGAILFNTDYGEEATPFLRNLMRNDEDFYAFRHMRAPSGITIDALPALMTGCLPTTDDSARWVQEPGRSIGYDFAAAGYAAASFSSRALDATIVKGQWKMLYDLLVGGMDRASDPIGMGWKQTNEEGCDDRLWLPEFEGWIRGLDGNATAEAAGGGGGGDEEGSPSSPPKPFYAQFYTFNQHFPYLRSAENDVEGGRYYHSLRTLDQFLEGLFDVLSRTGRLEDTVIVGSGDHGEDPFKAKYVRLAGLNSNVLQPASYVYYPRRLMSDPAVADRLRRNSEVATTHTLDLYPTIRSVLKRGYDPLAGRHEECVTGVDLTTVDLPPDRVVLSWNFVSSRVMMTKPARFLAMSTLDPKTGKELTMYHRLHRSRHPALQQGTDDFYVLLYGDCTRNIDKDNLCMDPLTDEYREIFREAVRRIKEDPYYHEAVKRSLLVEKFAAEVGLAGTTDRDAALGPPDGGEGAAAAAATDDRPREGSSGAGGFLASIVHSVQEQLGARSDEPSCDDVLLYLPDMLANLGHQLRSYLLAAKVATFLNKALVVLDEPQDVICPKDEKDYPLGLSSILNVPAFLSKGCPAPCQATHGFAKWSELRINSDPEDPVDQVCTGDDGRRSRVLPVGSHTLQVYFERLFKDQMLARPSPNARDWALRLGASPEEAEVFAGLEGDSVIWDYLDALMVRSGALTFSDKVERDVNEYKEKNVYGFDFITATKDVPYVAVHARRGEGWRKELLTDAKAHEFVKDYWARQGVDMQDYLPLQHYVRQFLFWKRGACKKKDVHWVYIVTNDPDGVRQEIDALGPKVVGAHKVKGVKVKDCHVVSFTVSQGAGQDREGSSPSGGTCAKWYTRAIAQISEFQLMVGALVLVGDPISDWGKLARISRLKFNSDSGFPVLLKDTRAAYPVSWGYAHPGPENA